MNEQERLFIRELTYRSLYYFDKIIIGHTGQCHGIKQSVHRAPLDFIQDDSIKRHGLLMPRYFLKSSTVTKSKPIWDWLHDHEERIIVANERYKKAEEFVSFTRKQIESNELLHHIYPETVMSKEWQKKNRWSQGEFDMPREGIYDMPTVKAIGVGAASQGLHGTKIYLDDLIGKKAMMSKVVMQDTFKWFDNSDELLDEPDPTHPNASHVYLIGTHYAPGDLYVRVRNTDKTYKWMKVRAEDENNIPTWPEKLSAERIKWYKAHKPIVFASQMQNNPTSSGVTDFDEKWLRYYDKIVVDDKACIAYTYKKKVNEEWVETRRVVQVDKLEKSATIDPGFSEGGIKKTCRTAIVVCGVDPETNKKIVLEAWAERISKPSQLYSKVFEYNEKYRPIRWGVEIYGGQRFVLEALREKAFDKHVHLPIIDLPYDVSKDAKDVRIRSLQDEFASEMIFISADMYDLIGEYLAFPMPTTTNDILDAFAWQKIWWIPLVTAEQIEEEEYADWDMQLNADPITGYYIPYGD